MYSSSFYGSTHTKNYSTIGTNPHSNLYYASKIYDDNRFQRRKLQKPGFLIKQQKIYPQSSSYSISDALSYADNLTRPPSHKFYSFQAEQQRVRVQGKNPFLSESITNRNFSELGQSSYMKKSSRSRMDTNPNLGVTSYQVLRQVLDDFVPTQANGKKQGLNQQEFSPIKKPSMQQYITQSLIENFNERPPQRSSRYRTSMESENQMQQKYLSRRQTFNPQHYQNTKKQSTLVRLDKNPEQLTYKGKKFTKLII